MNILWITNNYGDIRDAIGVYTARIASVMHDFNEIDSIEVIDGSTAALRKWQRFFSMTMTKKIWEASRKVANGDFDCVIMEYPFMEWNPTILFAVHHLKSVASNNNAVMMLSLHEYLRANKMRKYIIRCLLPLFDVVTVSDEMTYGSIAPLTQACCIRSIPNLVPINWDFQEGKRIDRSFIYFGLVNTSKAFQEMLDAFEQFNQDGKKELLVFTSSEIDDFNCPSNVSIFKSRSDEEIAEALKDASFCLLPLVPEVTECSSSLKAAAQAGCILIGHFDSSLCDQRFAIHVKEYSIDSLAAGMQQAYEMTDSEIVDLNQASLVYGKGFSSEKTAQELMSALQGKMGQRL